MKRSIIKHGPSTLIVSLPAKWAKINNLSPGSEVDVEPQGNRLIINTGGAITTPTLNLDVTGLSPFMISRLLARSYQKGYDVINLKYADRKSMQAIREKVTELLGFDIIEEEKNSCSIRSIASTLNLDFDQALRKAFLRIVINARDLKIAYEKSDTELIQSIQDSDLDVNKMTYFCLRTLSKGKIAGYDAFVLYHLIESLEDVGDEIKKLASNISNTSIKNKWTKSKLSILIELCETAFNFFYGPTQDEAIKVFDLVAKLYSIENLPAKINKDILKNEIYFYRIADLMYLFAGMRLDTISELLQTSSIKA